MIKKLITFCVPSYNSAPYLHYALDSLIVGGEDIEVLIIDDGSTDTTLQIAKDYENRYPYIFKAIHEENRGHGGAINNALSQAKGVYFKVLDSDDWVNEQALVNMLDFIKSNKDETDLFLTDYVYFQGRENKGKTIRFNRYIKPNIITSFNNVKTFNIRDNITLHSATYKTSVLKESKVILPMHMSYEDNYFVYAPLHLVNKVTYLGNAPLYQYLIGRPGQSMENNTMIRKWKDFVDCGKLIFSSCDIMPYYKKNFGLYRILKHQLVINIAFVPLFIQLNGSKEAKEALKDFWVYCKSINPKQYHMVKKNYKVFSLSLPGKPGERTVKFWYWAAHKVIKFN